MENINNISIIIVLIILSFGILGLKRGVIKEAAVVLGNIAAIILAFLLKGLLASFLINLFFKYYLLSVNSFSRTVNYLPFYSKNNS